MRKRLPLVVLIAATLAVLALAVAWSRRPAAQGFPTPADCLDAWCAARADGDAARCLDCLAEPLRSELQQRFPDTNRRAEHQRLDMDGVLSWAQHPQGAPAEAVAVIDLEETRASSARWTRFRLQQTGRGWLIAHIGQPQERPLSYRPGAPVDEGREGAAPRTEP